MTRPDMYVISGYEGKPLNIDQCQHLPEEYLIKVKKLINETMINAALEDYQMIIQSDKLDFKVLEAVDKFFDRDKITELINSSDPKDYSNLYLVSVCEFGVMLGYLFNQIEGFGWLYCQPYFHSIIVHTETGYGIPVFDWAVKKFSAYGVDDGFVAKFHVVLEEVNKRSVSM